MSNLTILFLDVILIIALTASSADLLSKKNNERHQIMQIVATSETVELINE